MQEAILDQIEPLSEGVVALTLRGVTGPLAPWEPGAHIDVALPNWLKRQYSLCGDQTEGTYRIAVRHEPLSRGGSEYIHLFLQPGRSLEVSVPRNNFPIERAPDYLFIAGGIGITPILPMMRATTEGGATTRLVYAGRSETTMPFVEEVVATHGDRVVVVAEDRHGMPDLPALADTVGPRTLVYCCGPEPMLAAAEAAFPADCLRVERFRPRVREFAPNTPFEVDCARTGRTVAVPADESMLDALNYAGLPVPSGCREGVCGSCEVTVLEGEPEHRDEVGSPADRLYPCVSRALSDRLVVNL